MRRTTLSVVFSFVMLSAFAMAADDAPTPEQLKQFETEKNWTELLKGTTRVLALKGPAAEVYDRVQVWSQKAEAQLQSKLFSPASESFEKASKEKGVTPELADHAFAMSLVMLKTDARGFHMPPTKANPSPAMIDVTNTENRTEAIKLLFEADYADVVRDLNNAKKKPVFNDLIKVVRDANKLPPLERAATKSEDKSKQVVTDASSLMADTINKWAEDSTKQVEVIRTTANEVVRSPGKPRTDGKPVPDVMRKRGLTGKDRADLTEIAKECERVADGYKRFVEQSGEPKGELANIPKRVESLYDDANKALKADYSSVYK